jgi:shikimate kinase
MATANPQSAFSVGRNPQTQIFLVGFMASGKSTVGPLLAAKLGRPFFDLDRLIEAEAGCVIAELIAREGEDGFRQIETARLRDAARGEAAVIAPGGGVITRAENRVVMASFGVTIWLDAPFELCWRRIQQDAVVRPLAASEEAARARFEERAPLYQSAAIRLPIRESQTPEEIVVDIFRRGVNIQ